MTTIWDNLNNILYQLSKVNYYENHYDKVCELKLEIIHLLSFLTEKQPNLYYIKEYFRDKENILKILEIVDKYKIGDYTSIKKSLYTVFSACNV